VRQGYTQLASRRVKPHLNGDFKNNDKLKTKQK
jgi:hypothetical protein